MKKKLDVYKRQLDMCVQCATKLNEKGTVVG